MNKTALAVILIIVIVVGVVLIVRGMGGKSSGGIGSAPVEKTYSVKCLNPQCGFTDPQMPETSYKALKSNVDEKGMMKCPQCGQFTLVDAGPAPGAGESR